MELGVGGNCPPPQFNKTRKFSVNVGNFEGGIETAMKNESPLRRKEFLFQMSKQNAHAVCSIFLSFHALTVLSKARKMWLGIG